MEIIWICTVFGVFLCLAFSLGAKVGQTIVQNKTLEIPNLNPIKKVQEIKKTKEEKKELDKMNKILQNIENYDGTGANQQEV